MPSWGLLGRLLSRLRAVSEASGVVKNGTIAAKTNNMLKTYVLRNDWGYFRPFEPLGKHLGGLLKCLGGFLSRLALPWGVSWKPFGPFGEPLGASWRLLRGLLVASGVLVGRGGRTFNWISLSWAPLELRWELFGLSWAPLGPSLDRLGRLLDRLGAFLCRLRALWGASWVVLERSRGLLRSSRRVRQRKQTIC